jgi:uncharacterized protein (TIGR03435 family)
MLNRFRSSVGEWLLPGEVQPTHDEQTSMLRSLLTERFQLTFHRELKDFSIYDLQVAKGGPKAKPSPPLLEA